MIEEWKEREDTTHQVYTWERKDNLWRTQSETQDTQRLTRTFRFQVLSHSFDETALSLHLKQLVLHIVR